MRARAFLALAGTVLVGSAVDSHADQEEGPLVLVFERYNGSYPALEGETQPFVRGPLSVRLSSPRFDLEVLAHRLELAPEKKCRHKGTFWGRFSGEGELVADVEVGAFPASFDDRVIILEQERAVEALVTIDVAPEGYRVTLDELPRTISIEIESELAGGLVSFCRRMSLFVIGDAGCGALDQVLSNPTLALPPPGTRVLVGREQLEEAEREALESYLATSGECATSAIDPIEL